MAGRPKDEESAPYKVTDRRGRDDPAGGPRAHNVDPLVISPELEAGVPYSTFHPGASGLDWTQLRYMARVPVVASVVQVMLSKLSDCLVQQVSPYEPGWRVGMVDRKAKMTPAAEKRAAEIGRVLLTGGGRWYPGGMEASVTASMRDSFVGDQFCSEVLTDRIGNPTAYVPVDAATMRLAKPTGEQRSSGRYYPGGSDAVVVEKDTLGQVVNAWDSPHMMWGIRRQRTDQGLLRYGYPEFDDLCSVVTWIVNSLTANAVTFTNGMHASTIVSFFSKSMDPEQWKALTRSMTAMLSGVRNAKRTVMLQLDPDEKVTATPLGVNNKDMEFSAYLNFLLKVLCSLFGIDPAEINFVFGNEGQTSSLGQRGPGERINASRDRWLWSTLRKLASWLTHWIVQPLDPDFMMEFGGRGSLSESERLDMIIKQVRCMVTVDESRAMLDLKPLGGLIGNMILDPQAAQAIMQSQGQGTGEDEGNEEDLDGFDDALEGAEPGEELPAERGETVKSHGEWRRSVAGALDRYHGRLEKAVDRRVREGAIVARPRARGQLRKGRIAIVPAQEKDVRAWIVEA